MPWCPVCKEEYKEGISTCPECKVELVASLEDANQADYQDLINFSEGKLAQKFTEYLQYSKINAKVRYDKKTGNYIISVLKKDVTKAKKHFSAFYSVETSNALSRNQDGYHGASEITSDETDSFDETDNDTDVESCESDDTDQCPCDKASGPYVSMAEKRSDLFSTLVVFSVFGVAGLVFLALELLGIINLMNQIMIIIAIAIFCVGIPVVLYTTYKSYQTVKSQVAEEEKLTANLNEWMESVFTEETVRDLFSKIRVNAPGIPEEQLYLMLNQVMKKRISDQFGEMNEAYLDYIVDTFYDAHFSEDFTDETDNI